MVDVSGKVARRRLGTQGLEVSALGLGCSGLSGAYGSYSSEEDTINLFQHAFNSGITFFDTSDFYGHFANEILIGKVLKYLPRDRIQLATKFGAVIKDDLSVEVVGTAEHVRKACEASLQRLDVEYIDLYYQHRVDQKVPIEETVGEMKKLVEEGKIKHIGLCEASVDTLKRAYAVHPITAVQYEWSLWSRDIENEIIPTCRELGIGIVPYSPLGRGFFSGKALKEINYENTRWSNHPRFQPENLAKNKVLFDRISCLAEKHKCTPAQLALAWILHQGDDVVPIPGTTKIKNLEGNIQALNLKFSTQVLEEIAAAVPANEIAGSRSTPREYYAQWNFANTPPLGKM
ncbi:hypothetical protein SUGI_1012230 [Cryptomeria japonica]|uniref:probable aldo-keto reductase 1 n=1 Tax=Cryptomeria japonica TaxID=3369 RepID=UPI002414A02E|nr:probable aldo-keto reductase 1 [Cryptomeria japonica]GLJ47939.1 hypothetical protein SUGI_1012230 [Cryptomeria japonica]